MTDGPVKVGPAVEPIVEPEPLDDIILGEDEESEADSGMPSSAASSKASRSPPPAPAPTKASVPPAAKTSVVPPAKASAPPPANVEKAKRPSSSKTKAAEVAGDKEPKKRSKMTLRIPDDEISRPQLPATTPGGGVAAVTTSAATTGSRPPPPIVDDRFDPPPIKPQRIIAAGGADDTVELPADEVRARMAAITNETSARAAGIDTSDERGWTPYQPSVVDSAPVPSSGVPPTARNGGETIVDIRERLSSAPPASEEIPIDTDDVPDPSSDDLATRPRLPDGPDSEEIKLDDTEGDRVTDPADAPELDPDDLLSVESLPKPATAAAGKSAALKPPTTASAAALMATATPAATPPVVVGVVTPPAPAVAPVGSPQVAPVAKPTATPRTSSPEITVHTPATPFRPVQPGVIVPPVGALAPPPMNEAAAMRKKARPWWEELFNDDFIRTMAKITESQIKDEVDFIEESLGCEAGAMVLDLACGTGRHAIELATRGYQVVGFDLSLAMLARASDEAQDRKQKINFVQGDMRDMTFEETFDGVYAWNTSFGYFDEEKNAAVIGKVHKALKKGGQFLLDVVNRDYIVRQAPSLAWFEGEGCICMDEMQIDFITSRMKVKRTLMMDDGRTKEIEYSIRIYALHELGKMLHDNGFRVAEVSGRTATPGVFFGCESPRTLILAEKR